MKNSKTFLNQKTISTKNDKSNIDGRQVIVSSLYVIDGIFIPN